MSITYYARSGGCFDVNVAGADCLGLVHRRLGLRVSEAAVLHPRVPFAATGPEARRMAAKLRRIEDATIAAIQPSLVLRGWWDDSESPADLVIWIRRWEEFLVACNGYDSDPDSDADWAPTLEPDYAADPVKEDE